jgi:hypothetical protein
VQIEVTNFRKGDPINVEPVSHPDTGLCFVQCWAVCQVYCWYFVVATAGATGGGNTASSVSYPFDSGESEE